MDQELNGQPAMPEVIAVATVEVIRLPSGEHTLRIGGSIGDKFTLMGLFEAAHDVMKKQPFAPPQQGPQIAVAQAMPPPMNRLRGR